jgi:uncharacterized protein YdaU (DUF1376 family)
MTKRKHVMRLDVRDLLSTTMTMTREQKGLYLELLILYANGIEIPAHSGHAAKHVRGASLADLDEVLDQFRRIVHEDVEDNEAFGPRIYDERIEPLHVSNRAWRW